jgi:mannose-6-phosphate isomerase-like protein (cupin superfamily)
MAERERTRTRERGATEANSYERFIRFRREFEERQETGPIVIKPSDREYENNRQGHLMYYLDPLTYKDPPLHDWYVFTHDVRTHSGKHRHQGGIVIYIIEGKGYSVVDDERVDWETGDLLLLPIKPKGVEHQHFNAEPGTPCHWVAFLYLPIMEYVAMEFTQMQIAPDFKG